MKNLVRHITVLIVISLAFSCNDDFLYEEMEHEASITISPDWPTQDYSIYFPNVGNAKYKVIKKPDWLKISSPSGQFTNGFATLKCKANTYGDFSDFGIYYAYMTLEVEGKGNKTILIEYFVEGNPAVKTENFVTLNWQNNSEIMKFKNTGNGILLLVVLELPEWLMLVDNYGGPIPIENYPAIILPSNGEGHIQISYNHTVPFSGNFFGKIIIGTNDKNRPIVEIEVQLDLGYPSLNLNIDQLDFGRDETIRNIGFYNSANGILAWKIEGCPEWLSISESNGVLPVHNSTTISITCNRELMPLGANMVTIYLKSNDKEKPLHAITITARNGIGNYENVIPIDGNITNAYLDRQSDILYLTTAQPNRLLVFDTKKKTIAHELLLQFVPTCFSLSVDGKHAIIGYNGYITYINAVNFSVVKTIEVSHNLYSIEYAKDGWCCYTELNDQWGVAGNLYWINLNTNEINKYNAIDKGCFLQKVPGQNLIIASEGNSSKKYVFNINTREIKYNTSGLISAIWFSEDGTILFSENDVCRTFSLFTQEYFYIGYFSPSLNRVHWVDHHAASSSVWVLSASSPYYDGEPRLIFHYEDKKYTRIRTCYFDDQYKGNLVRPHYIFVNQSGTELCVIRNVTNGNVMWSLEFIPIK